MFVFLTGFREPGLMIVTVLMVHKLHTSVHRIPVGMYVEGTHKNTDHQSLIVEIGFFLYFLDDYDSAVCRSHHDILGITAKITDGTTIKINDNAIEESKNCHKYPEWNLRIKTVP
jgi:hypothetical protein